MGAATSASCSATAYSATGSRLGRRLPYTTLEGDCTAEGTSTRTAEGEDACYYQGRLVGLSWSVCRVRLE